MANAFQEMAAQSAASTSSSSKEPCYDVFINHRGIDVKHKLASSIYQMLDLVGVRAFLDEEELELGDSFPQAIEKAMRSASVHIAIFSPRYAESAWCLAELCFMFQINVTIIPVFYGVDPSDVRYAKGKYADAFDKHRSKGRYSLEKIEAWKKALTAVSYLKGYIVDPLKWGQAVYDEHYDEGKLLRKIVESALCKRKHVPLDLLTFPVGLDEIVQDFESKVESSTSSQDVDIVGIVGMGGSGKTTLARELYNRKCSFVSRSCFLSNVRDAASKNTLSSLQKKLLKSLRVNYSDFDDIHEGKKFLARDLRSMTVLIVLDDVDGGYQLDALLPAKDNFGPCSFIIVTTRDVDILTTWGISSNYRMKLLDPLNAKQLFCIHAFQLGFEFHENYLNLQDLIERFVKACMGLPLSLKVLGAMLKGKRKSYWESQLQKISRILPEEITERLKPSYEALDLEDQHMFLDTACFFLGYEKSLVVAIWDGSGWSGEVGLETLVNKCLVAINDMD